MFFKAKIEQIALASHTKCVAIDDLGSLSKGIDAPGKYLVVIDLESARPEISEIAHLAKDHVMILGYCSHVRREVADEARAKGLDNIVAKSGLEGKIRSMILSNSE